MWAKAITPGSTSDDGATAMPSARPTFHRALRATALLLAIWCVLAVLTQSGEASVATIFFSRDALWLLAFAVLLTGLSLFEHAPFVRMVAPPTIPVWSWRTAAILVLLVATFAMVGPRLVFHGHAFTQDETMAQFDAAIFRSGLWVARIPEAWRPFADALEPRFTMPIADHAAWISVYLPGNAAIRAVLDRVFGLDVASALLAALAIVAVGGVARRLWPDRPDAAFVAALLLATSPQFLFTAATPFAMTAHLALDLVWLWLFLRGGALGHGGAIAVTFAACGLHQIVFHPLFACPFVLQLWLGRRWRLAAMYTIAFAAAGVFWILYWQLVLTHEGLHGTGRTGSGIAPFFGEVLDLVGAFGWAGLDLMVKNVTRFLAWQNPIAVALAFVAMANLHKLRRPMLQHPLAALAAGLALTLVAMFVLLPNQGFGWGYRYLHGLLGSFCLLGAWGWIVVTGVPAEAQTRPIAWAIVGLASLFTAAIVIPSRAVEIESFVAPYAAAERAIQASSSDLVFVDTNGSAYTTALVRNDPFLRNRPLVLDLSRLTTEQVESLCAAHTVSLFDHRDSDAYGILRSQPLPEAAQRATLRRLGCASRSR